jgi:hypothetical protein
LEEWRWEEGPGFIHSPQKVSQNLLAASRDGVLETRMRARRAVVTVWRWRRERPLSPIVAGLILFVFVFTSQLQKTMRETQGVERSVGAYSNMLIYNVLSQSLLSDVVMLKASWQVKKKTLG